MSQIGLVKRMLVVEPAGRMPEITITQEKLVIKVILICKCPNFYEYCKIVQHAKV